MLTIGNAVTNRTDPGLTKRAVKPTPLTLKQHTKHKRKHPSRLGRTRRKC